jgi:hypothetical protein
MDAMSEQPVTINRVLVGTLALACFVAAFGAWWFRPEESFWWAAFIRVGLFMAVFWFALPTHGRQAAWANVSPWTIIIPVVIVVALPRYWKLLVPLLAAVMLVGLVLRPKKKPRPGGPTR